MGKFNTRSAGGTSLPESANFGQNDRRVLYRLLIYIMLSREGKYLKIINPLPVQFKALLHGQKGCVFFSGHLNLRTAPETGLPSREKNHNN